MKLYYLTPPQFALAALALKRLKLARLGELNDPFELQAVDAETPLHQEFFRRVKNKIDASHGVLCFSKSWKNPVLWGHYADKLRGVALGFEVRSPHLVPVAYASVPTKIRTNPETGLPLITEELVNLIQRTKFKDWQYEDEMRVYVQLDHDTRESGLYFYPFDEYLALTEIVLGPRCDLPKDSLSALLESYSRSVKITESEMSGRSFEVIERVPPPRASA